MRCWADSRDSIGGSVRAPRRRSRRIGVQTRTYARSVIDRPAARPLRSNLVTGPLLPPRHHSARQQRLGVEHLDHLLGVVGPVGGQPPHPPGARREAARAANDGVTRRRLWCFFLCHGSGKNVHSSASSPGPSGAPSTTPRRREQNRTLVAPALGHPPQRVGDAGPPDLEGQHVVRRPGRRQGGRRLADARADLHDRSAPRARTSRRQPEARLVDRLVGDHPRLVVGVPRLPAGAA